MARHCARDPFQRCHDDPDTAQVPCAFLKSAVISAVTFPRYVSVDAGGADRLVRPPRALLAVPVHDSSREPNAPHDRFAAHDSDSFALMNALTIRIKKLDDANSALSCIRANGTSTWQRHRRSSGAFFPLHDLTHYAVETTLDVSGAFYGLLATGWEIDDFGPPWPRGPLPPIALDIELIVGFLDAERAGGVIWSAEDLRDKAALYYAANKREAPRSAPSSTITDEQLDRIRARRGELFAQWTAVPIGDVLELTFTE